MEKLIVVRHGNYKRKTGKLTSVGDKQIEKLANFIKKTCSGSYYFASSKADRATESALRLIHRLSSRPNLDIWEGLFDEKDYLALDKTKEIDKNVASLRDHYKNLILVSHFSVATGYPTYFMQKEFEDIRGIDNVSMGKAVLVDIVKKDYDIIPY